jgi:hypothetical protein
MLQNLACGITSSVSNLEYNLRLWEAIRQVKSHPCTALTSFSTQILELAPGLH